MMHRIPKCLLLALTLTKVGALALSLWLPSAASADVTLDFNQALDAYTAGDFSDARKLFEPLAKSNHVQSQMLIGVMYLR